MREMSAENVVRFKNYIDQLKSAGMKETSLGEDVEIMVMVISFCACDEQGNLLFESPEDARGLTGNNINLLMDLGNKALELSGVKMGGAGLTSEVADNLPNDPQTSLLDSLPLNLGEAAVKS
jgi:hypothetical protein